MANVTIDSSQVTSGLLSLEISVGQKTRQALNDIATEILHLSQFEVPHDTGNLQNSGQIDAGESQDEVLVGYNTVYAAYQHEGMRADGTHVIHNYQSGRKGKYLEDPIRRNLDSFRSYLNGIFDK